MRASYVRDSFARGLSNDEPVDTGIRGQGIESFTVEFDEVILAEPSVALTLDTDGLLYSVHEELEKTGLDLGVQSCGNQLGLGDPVPSPFPDREFDGRACCQVPLEVNGPGSAQTLRCKAPVAR